MQPPAVMKFLYGVFPRRGGVRGSFVFACMTRVQMFLKHKSDVSGRAPRYTGGMNTCDVAVVGAGSVGAAAALAFARGGKRVVLVDPRPAGGDQAAVRVVPAAEGSARSFDAAAGCDDWDARVFALSPASVRLLLSLGVWERLDGARVAPVHDMRLFHDQDGGKVQESLRLDAFQGCVQLLAHIVEGRHLQQALDATVAEASWSLGLRRIRGQVSRLVLPARANDHTLAQLMLDGGQTWEAGLVVAADGARSSLREMAGLSASVFDYGQTAVVANFNSSLPTRDAAWQWFDAEMGVMALLPLPALGRPEGQGRVSLVWSAPTEWAQALRAMPVEGLAEQVAWQARGALGNLQCITPAASFPLRSVSCARVIAPAFVMIGDAAHVVHPMAGQGMNLGFGDVQALGDVLLGQGVLWRGGQPGWLALRRYERARREPVAGMQALMTGLHRAFGPLPLPLALLRNLGWQAVAASGWARRQLIAHAIR